MTSPTIGFIGLGLLGHAIVKRLLSTGHAVVGHDIVADRVSALAPLGMSVGRSAGDVARRSDIVLLCVTTTADVMDIVDGPDGIKSAGRLDGKVLVDHSTSEIETTRRLAGELASGCGMAFVDAPVSGGPGAAESGTLSIMAGGDEVAVEAVRPVMERLGRFTHMGASGAGQATKLVNQTLVLPNFCLMAEALRLAQAFGVDARKIPHALATGFAGSNLLPVLFERMIDEDFAPRGYARQALKDLEMLHEASRGLHLPMPMSSQALTLFRMLVAQGDGESDGSAVITLLPKPAPHPD